MSREEFDLNNKVLLDNNQKAQQKDLAALDAQRQKVIASDIDPTVKLQILNDLAESEIKIRQNYLKKIEAAMDLKRLP
jgi:hypothetical protein